MVSFLSAVFLGKDCFVENSGILLCFVNSITNRAYKTVTKSLKNGNGTNIFSLERFCAACAAERVQSPSVASDCLQDRRKPAEHGREEKTDA
jgi:hypothetical protein